MNFIRRFANSSNPTLDARDATPPSTSAPDAAGARVELRSAETIDVPRVMNSMFDEGRDGDLVFSWQLMSGTANAGESSRREATNAFFDAFSETYARWEPARARGADEGDDSDVGCAVAHPRAVTLAAVEDAAGLGERLERALTGTVDVGGIEQRMASIGVETFRALEIMSRSAHNRVFMEQCGASRALANACKTCAQRMLTFSAGAASASKENSIEAGALLEALQHVVEHAVNVIDSFLGDAWALRSFNENGALLALIEVLRAEKVVVGRVHGDVRKMAISIERMAMRAIGRVMHGDAAVQKSIAGAGGLDIFFEGVYPIEADVSVDIAGFETSLMNLEISHTLLAGNKSNVERAQGIGLFTRVARLMRAANDLSETLVSDEASTSTTEGEVAGVPWSAQLLDDSLRCHEVIITDGYPSEVIKRLLKFVHQDTSAAGGWASKGAREMILKCLFDSIIEACSSSKESFKSDSECVRFRAHVLRFFSDAIDIDPAVLRVMRQARAWDMLLDADTYGAIPSVDHKKEYESVSESTTSILRRRVQIQTAALLLKACQIAAELSDCVDECNVLIGTITTRAIQPSVAIRLCRVLELLLIDSSHSVCKALSEVEAPGRLAGALNAQLKCWGCDQVAFIGEVGATANSAAFGSTLSALRACLNGPDVLAASALNNDGVSDLIFNELLWTNTTRDLAISAVVSLVGLRLHAPSPHTSGAHREAWSSVARRFIQALPRARGTDITLLSAMLSGLRQMLNNPNGSGDSLREWISSEDGAEFVQIVALCDGDAGEEVGLDVIATVQAVISNSHSSASTFERSVGYDTLIDAIQCARGAGPVSKPLFDALMSFVIDDDYGTGGESSGIALRNAKALQMLLTLIGNLGASDELKDELLKAFKQMLSASVTSKATADAAGVLDFCLQWYVDANRRQAVLEVIALCSSFSMSTKHVRQIFRLLQGDSISADDQLQLLRVLQHSAKRVGPSTFFDFTGPGCGIHVNKQLTLPVRNGYTVSMWFRIERFPEYGGPVPLFSLLSGAGNGILGELHANKLTLGIRGSTGTVDTASIDITVRENEWTFLTIVHLPVRMSQPLVRVFLDAGMVGQAKLRYPIKSTEAISYCRIASVTFDVSLENAHVKVSPFFGQLGSTHIFDDALSQPAIAMIHALGADYVGRFKSTESQTERILQAISVNAVEARDTREYLADHRLISISAITVAGRSTQSEVYDVNEYDLIGGAKVCVTNSVKDVVHCLGGVQVVLPIFSDILHAAETSKRRQIVCEGVHLLVALLDGSRLNQVTLTLCDGYALIANLLRENATTLLCPDLLPALDRLRRAGGIEHESASARIVVDLHLWSLADDATQKAHGEYLLSLATKHSDGLRFHLPTSDLIDALDFTPGASGTSRRRVLLDVLKQLVINAPNQIIEETAETIVHVIEECADEDTVGDVLRWLVNCMQPGEEVQPTLYQAFTKLGGPLLALSPLSRSSRRVRSFALLWLANLMPPLEASSKSSGGASHISAAFGAAAGALTATLGGKFTATASQDFEVGFFTAVANALEKFPLDIAESRSALFELLLGGQALPAEKVAERLNREKNSSVRAAAGRLFAKVTGHGNDAQTKDKECISVGVPGIVNAGAAGVLLRLMNSSDNAEMRLSVLELLLQLVEGASVNAQAVLEQRGWQTWILPILKDHSDETQNDEKSMARRLITALLSHAVLKTDEGHQHVSNMLGVIDILIKRGVLADESDLAQELLSDLLECILPTRASSSEQDEWSEVQNVESPICRRNLSRLLHIFDSIISDTSATAATLGVPSASDAKSSVKKISWRFYDNLWNLLDAISPPGHPVDAPEETADAVKSTNMAQKLHRRAKSMIRDLPFSSNSESEFDSVEAVEALRKTCQRMGFRLTLLYVRASALEELQPALNTCIGLLPSFLAPVLVDKDGKAMDTAPLGNRAHLFIADLMRYVEFAKKSEDPDASTRSQLVVNLVRLASEVGRLLLSDCASVEECAHLDGRDLISEQKVAAAAAIEAKESRKVKELRSKVSENFLSERTRHEQRQAQAETALLQTHKSKLGPVSERERARRAMQRLTFEERCDVLARRWSAMLRDLQGERGAWAAENCDAKAHWKLDKSEDSSMRRSRLKRDYKFVQYEDNQKGGESTLQSDVQDIQAVRLVGMGQKWKMNSDSDYVDVDDVADELAEKLAVDKENAMHNRSKVVFSTPASLVTLTRTVLGKLNVSRDAVVFAADRTHESAKDHRKRFWRWSLSEIVEVHHMRYRLQHKAFEMHCADHTSAFFAFDTKKTARYAAARVASSAGATLMNRRAKTEAAERAKELWRRQKLSTFDYLMALNVFAGRTLHDLSQYPVFPWVLKEYEAETIDLADPSVYRDLRKPVGALNEERLKNFVDRYKSLLDDPDTPPFHYGSHYSSSPIVLFFLLRLEPYTKLARALQGDRFDRADRLFHSVAETFKACVESSADVKELIPEFYYSSEFLTNTNGLKLGVRQDGSTIDDVVLPPWAKGSRHEFTRVMRESLESDYVSENLHHWVDLIFGHAQRGAAAVERCNVFYYLTYEGAVDIDTLEDDDQRNAIETQIINFGQTPAQIFRRAHPVRLPPQATEHVVSISPESLKLATVVSSESNGLPMRAQAVVHATAYDSRIAVVTAGRMVSIQRLQRPGTTFGLGGVDHSTAYALEPETTSRLMLEIDVDADSLAHSQSVNVALKGKVLLSVGHWDRSMRIFDIEEGREMQRISAHRDVTTCLALCELGSSRSWDESSHQMDQVIVVTGSRDTTLAIWEMVLPQGGWGFSKGTKVLSAEPKMICFGHDEAITCVAMNSSLNLVASGSIDGTLILHDSRDGHIVRALESTPPGCIPSSIELLPKSSLVVCACGVAGALSVHDVNGATLAKSLSRHEAFDAFCVTRDERHILIGNRRGDITVRAVHDLSIRAQINVANAGVVSISPVARDECLVVGLADGRVCLWAPAARSL